MTANQITLVVAPVAILAMILFVWIRARKIKKNAQIKTHGPHTPGAGYDPKEMARSKLHGLGISDR